MNRRQFIAGGLGALALAGCSSVRPEDRLRRHVLGELSSFTEWLTRERVAGYIGEVGWPDNYRGEATKWNQVADAWYAEADRAALWVTAWASGEWWAKTYPLACYYRQPPASSVNTANTQAQVIERHLTSRNTLRGVSVAGGAFGAPSVQPYASFSNRRPGLIERDYHYDGFGSYMFLAGRGVRLARVEFRWERVQPELGGPLDAAEVSRLAHVVDHAERAGIGVILDLHNYGGYYVDVGGRGERRGLGSVGLPIEAFANVWERLSAVFQGRSGVVGYGLMNEPADLQGADARAAAQTWEDASQAAVDSVRGRSDGRLLLIGGYGYSDVSSWVTYHPQAWVRDPGANCRYEGHHYWDSDHSSRYIESYARQDRKLS